MRRQTLSSKHNFLALNFNLSARQTAEDATMFTFLKRTWFRTRTSLSVKHTLKICTRRVQAIPYPNKTKR